MEIKNLARLVRSLLRLIDVRPELKEVVKTIEDKVQQFDDTAQKKDIVKAIKDLKTKPVKDLTPDVIKGIDKTVKTLEKLVKAKPDYSELVKALDKEPVDNLEKYARYDEIQTRFNEKQLKELKDAIKSITDGQLHTVLRGKEDTGNSTITPLVADATFVGTSIDTLDYSALSIVLHTDEASATDGLVIEYSANGTDWHGGEVYTIIANVTKFFTPTMQARYLRVSYTNGDTDQTEFHLHTTLRKSPIKWSSHNIDDPIKDQDDAELIKAVITGKKVNGDYDNVSLTNGSNMKVSLEEFETGFLDTPLPVTKGLNIPIYDYIALTYVAAGNGAGEVETVTFKTGGSGGSTVATLTLTYDASDNLLTVTQS